MASFSYMSHIMVFGYTVIGLHEVSHTKKLAVTTKGYEFCDFVLCVCDFFIEIFIFIFIKFPITIVKF